PVEYVTGETPESVLDAVNQARPALLGGDIVELDAPLNQIKHILPNSPSARAGIEMAVYTAHADSFGEPLWQLFGGEVESVESDITIPIVEDAIDRARLAWFNGFRRFKIKVGEDFESDLQRVVAVHMATPSSLLRVDANQGFTADEALHF